MKNDSVGIHDQPLLSLEDIESLSGGRSISNSIAEEAKM